MACSSLGGWGYISDPLPETIKSIVFHEAVFSPTVGSVLCDMSPKGRHCPSQQRKVSPQGISNTTERPVQGKAGPGAFSNELKVSIHFTLYSPSCYMQPDMLTPGIALSAATERHAPHP